MNSDYLSNSQNSCIALRLFVVISLLLWVADSKSEMSFSSGGKTQSDQSITLPSIYISGEIKQTDNASFKQMAYQATQNALNLGVPRDGVAVFLEGLST